MRASAAFPPFTASCGNGLSWSVGMDRGSSPHGMGCLITFPLIFYAISQVFPPGRPVGIKHAQRMERETGRSRWSKTNGKEAGHG